MPTHIGKTCSRRWVPIILDDYPCFDLRFSFFLVRCVNRHTCMVCCALSIDPPPSDVWHWIFELFASVITVAYLYTTRYPVLYLVSCVPNEMREDIVEL